MSRLDEIVNIANHIPPFPKVAMQVMTMLEDPKVQPKELAEVIRMMIEIAGGMVADIPSDKDFNNPEIGPLLTKYLKGAESVATEDRVRIFRLIEKLAFESRDIVSNIHGAGSPETHRMTILKGADINAKKKMAKKLAGIKEGK